MNEGVSQIAGSAGHGIDPATGIVGSTTASEAVGAWGFHLGAVTQHVDGVVVLFWAFALFFGTLCWYLRAEDKREGYPMEDPAQPPRAHPLVGFPPPPAPKTFTLQKGGTVTLPNFISPGGAGPPSPSVPRLGLRADRRQPDARPRRPGLLRAARRGAPPDGGREAAARAAPRSRRRMACPGGDSDPVGMPVVGRDDKVAGHVRDLWVDRGAKLLRYLEVELNDGRRRLMPVFFANVSPKFRRVKTRSIFAEQFAAIPELKDPDRITAREEDRISAYFAGGKMFAEGVRRGAFGGPSRGGPDVRDGFGRRPRA
ncbi:photosynthetic reaction center subunit H [Methylobacterium persicinum]